MLQLSTFSYCARMNRLVATMLDHGWWTMQNVMLSLLLAISNGLGLKSLGYCFQLLEFHTYNSNKIVFKTVLYIPHSPLFSTLQLYGKYSTLFLFDPSTQNTLCVCVCVYISALLKEYNNATKKSHNH